MSRFLRACLFLSLTLTSPVAIGQLYPRAEAPVLADRLYDAELLSVTGRDSLRRVIRSGELPIITPKSVLSPAYGDSISAGQLLGYLYRAYYAAYLHRLGIGARLETMRQWEALPRFNPEMLNGGGFNEAVNRRLRSLPGVQYELATEAAARAAGRELPRLERVNPLLLDSRNITDTLVVPERSVMGYDLRQTLEGLSRVGLIPSDTLEAYTRQLDSSRLYPDHLLLRALATSAGQREARHLRIAARRRALEFLASRGLVVPDTVKILRADSMLLASEDNELLYAYIVPRFTVTLPRARGPADLAARLSQGLRKYDSRFAALDFRAEPDEAGERYRWTVRAGDSAIYRSGELYPPFEDEGLSWFYGYEWGEILPAINAFLEADNAPYRLYSPSARVPDDPTGPVKVPLLPLTSAAARTLTDPRLIEAVRGLTGPNARTFLSPAEVVAVRDSLRVLGYFDGLSEEEWRAGRDCTEGRAPAGLAGLLQCFPTRRFTEGDDEGTYEVQLERAPYTRFRVRLPAAAAEFLDRRFPGALEVPATGN